MNELIHRHERWHHPDRELRVTRLEEQCLARNALPPLRERERELVVLDLQTQTVGCAAAGALAAAFALPRNSSIEVTPT